MPARRRERSPETYLRNCRLPRLPAPLSPIRGRKYIDFVMGGASGFWLAPGGDRESHRMIQGTRLRLCRLLVCAVDRARAATRVAGPASADDLLPRDRWIRGGRPRAAGGDDPHPWVG